MCPADVSWQIKTVLTGIKCSYFFSIGLCELLFVSGGPEMISWPSGVSCAMFGLFIDRVERVRMK